MTQISETGVSIGFVVCNKTLASIFDAGLGLGIRRGRFRHGFVIFVSTLETGHQHFAEIPDFLAEAFAAIVGRFRRLFCSRFFSAFVGKERLRFFLASGIAQSNGFLERNAIRSPHLGKQIFGSLSASNGCEDSKQENEDRGSAPMTETELASFHRNFPLCANRNNVPDRLRLYLL